MLLKNLNHPLLEILMQHPTMEVNAALWKLVHGVDIPASAQLVVDYMLRYPTQNSFFSVDVYTKKRGSDAFTAHTEHGDVTVKDEPAKSKDPTYSSEKKERVGHFRISRGNGCVTFHHFWASDTTTDSSTGKKPQLYRIAYSEKTKIADGFGHAETKTLKIGRLTCNFNWFLWDWRA